MENRAQASMKDVLRDEAPVYIAGILLHHEALS